MSTEIRTQSGASPRKRLRLPTKAARRATQTHADTAVSSDLNHSATREFNPGWIAQAAYFRAEKRGFAPGGELDDWLAAEAEVTAQWLSKEERAGTEGSSGGLS